MALPDLDDLLAQYKQAKTDRNPVEQQWRLNAAYCLPREYAEWSTDGQPVTTQRLQQTVRYSYDGTGPISMQRYGAVLQKMLTPEGQAYHLLQATNKDIRKVYAVRKWFGSLIDMLLTRRHAARSLFKQAQGEVYTQLGVYGTACKTILWDKATPVMPRGGPIYTSWSMRDVFLIVDDMKKVVGVMRRFYLTPRGFKRKWGNSVIAPKSITESDTESGRDTKWVEFVHIVMHRTDYQADAIDVRRHPWCGYYVAVNDKQLIGEEQGFLSNPYITPRTFTSSSSPYGFAPAEHAFPALGSANAMKKTLIKQGHKAVDPTLLVNDDGVLSGRIDTRPNALIYGGINQSGQKLVAALETGSNFQVGRDLLEDERADIANNFLSVLFKILEESPDMTAAEVYERISKEASLVAPLMGRLQSEDMQPMLDREIALFVEHGELEPMPAELLEAKGEYNIEYSSPLAKAMYAEGVSGFMRVNEMATAIAQAQQDPSPLDHFNYDVAIPEMSDRMSVPVEWMATPEQVAAKRDERQKRFETEQIAKAAPAIASVVASQSKTQQGKNAGASK